MHNPLRNSQKNLFTKINPQKYTFFHKHKLSFDTHIFPRRNSHNINNINFFQKKSKNNLKQIQREIQAKLLDMSIQIENESDNEDNDISVDFLRKEKKRYTENPKKKKSCLFTKNENRR